MGCLVVVPLLFAVTLECCGGPQNSRIWLCAVITQSAVMLNLVQHPPVELFCCFAVIKQSAVMLNLVQHLPYGLWPFEVVMVAYFYAEFAVN